MGFTKVLWTTCSRPPRPRPPSPRRTTRRPARPCSDLYGQQIILAALADPVAKENTDLLTELYNAQGSYAGPGAVEQTDDQKAIAEQTKQREHFAAVSGPIDKTFGYVTRRCRRSAPPGGRPRRSHVRSRWQRQRPHST